MIYLLRETKQIIRKLRKIMKLGDKMAVLQEPSKCEFFKTESLQLPEISRYFERLERIGIPMDVQADFKLANAGDLPDSCYLVKKGHVISFENTYTGKQHMLSNNGPGSLIFLPSIFLRHRVTLNFMTSTPSKLVRIKRENLLNAILTDAEFAIGIINILASKFVAVNERYREEISCFVPRKLCKLLISLADKHGVDYDGKVLIKLKYSQQKMADYLHVNRITVAKIIKELTDAGLIERINDYYCIRSIDKLQRYMEDFNMYKSEINNLPSVHEVNIVRSYTGSAWQP
jgi:CRP/FNR family transcriptional regulator